MFDRGLTGARTTIDELEQVCRDAVRDLHLLGAAVSLISQSGSEAVAAVSDDNARALEAIRFDLGEGPGRSAFDAGRPVLSSDLEQAHSTWPAYAPVAREAGARAVYAFPLQLGASRFGVLTLYADQPRVLDAGEVSVCLSLAEAATEVLLNGGSSTSGDGEASLPSTIRFRSEVYQAQGMVMVDLGVDLVDALARMRAHAFVAGTDLNELALDIIAGRTRLADGDEP